MAFIAHLLFLPILGLCREASGPRLDFERTSWWFGTQTNSSELSHEFIFTNRGDMDLVILKVESGCDACLRANAKEAVVHAGQSGAVRCSLDARKATGDVRRSITVHSNDPTHPRMVLELGGDVRPAYRVSPDNPGLGSELGRTKTQVRVKPLVALREPLSRIECQESFLSCSITNAGDAGFMVHLELDPMAPRLRRTVLARVTSIDPRDPALHIPIDIANPPAIEVIPPVLELVGEGRREERILWVRQHGAIPMTLKDAIATPSSIRCEISRIANRPDYRVYVSMEKNSGGIGPESAVVLLMQDTTGNRNELKIPVRLAGDGGDTEPSP